MARKFRPITICLLAISGTATAIDVSKQGSSTQEGTYFASPYRSQGSANPYTDESGYVSPYRSYPGSSSSPSWPQSESQPPSKPHKQQPAAGTSQTRSQAGAGTSQTKTAASASGRPPASAGSGQTRVGSSSTSHSANRSTLDANGLSRPSVLKQSDKIGSTKLQP